MKDRKRQKVKKPAAVVITGDATIGSVKKWKRELEKALRSASSVQVEIGQISRIDVTFLQLLCAAHRTSAVLGKDLTIAGVEREPIASLLRQAGFLRHIGCHESTRRSCLWFETK